MKIYNTSQQYKQGQYIIGMGSKGKFWTLWLAGGINIDGSQDVNYLYKLSTDLDEAKRKTKGFNVIVDQSLSGQTWEIDTIEAPPLSPFRFHFGNHNGEFIKDVIKIKPNYVSWYLNTIMEEKKGDQFEDQREWLVSFVLKNDFVLFEDKYMPTSKRDEILKKRAFWTSLEYGHFYKDKERVQIKVKFLNSRSFEGNFGTWWVVNYVDEYKQVFTYKGSRPQHFENDGEWYTLRATIKHDTYNDKDQTLLSRIQEVTIKN